MGGTINYKGLPQNGPKCGPYNPILIASELRSKLHSIDPKQSDGALTKREVKAHYPRLKWSALVRNFNRFKKIYRGLNPYKCHIKGINNMKPNALSRLSEKILPATQLQATKLASRVLKREGTTLIHRANQVTLFKGSSAAAKGIRIMFKRLHRVKRYDLSLSWGRFVVSAEHFSGKSTWFIITPYRDSKGLKMFRQGGDVSKALKTIQACKGYDC